MLPWSPPLRAPLRAPGGAALHSSLLGARPARRGIRRHPRFARKSLHDPSAHCGARSLLYGEVRDSIDAKDSYFILLGILALRLNLDSSWGMSRPGRRDVEEGIVRVEYSGVYELGDIGHIGLGFVTRGARGASF